MYLAIDIGGTKTLIAAFSKNGRKLQTLKFPTPTSQTNFVHDLTSNLRNFEHYQPDAIVTAIPGPEYKNCSFVFGNRPWRNLDLTTPINSLFNCPVYYQNDANLATLYESAGRRGRTIFLTFSTGIGGGIAKDGKLLEQASHNFEPGHTKYLFQGQTREWEDIASCNAIGSAYHCIATDVRGRSAYQDIAARLALGLTDIIKEHHPSTIVIGGPLGMLFPKFRHYLTASLRRSIPNTKLPRLIKPKRPTESVIYGCYLYAKTRR